MREIRIEKIKTKYYDYFLHIGSSDEECGLKLGAMSIALTEGEIKEINRLTKKKDERKIRVKIKVENKGEFIREFEWSYDYLMAWIRDALELSSTKRLIIDVVEGPKVES